MPPVGSIDAVAPLRISFVGGGTDFPHWYEEHGGAVVSATIDHVVRVRITPRPDRLVEVRSLDLDRLVAYHLDEGPVYDGALDLVKAAIADAGTDVGISVEIRSEAPPGSGLGGSSALVTAVVAGLAMLGGRQMDAGTLARTAYRIEREDLGISGGWQDQYAAAFGGCNLIEFSRSGRRRGAGRRRRGDGSARERAPPVLHGPRAPQRRTDRSPDRHAPRGSRGDAARHEAPPRDGLRDARRDRARRSSRAGRPAPRGLPREEADEPAHRRAHADRGHARRGARGRRVRRQGLRRRWRRVPAAGRAAGSAPGDPLRARERSTRSSHRSGSRTRGCAPRAVANPGPRARDPPIRAGRS